MALPFRRPALTMTEFPGASGTPKPAGRCVGSERACGDCHACCVHLPIPAGEVTADAKPPGVACPHLCQQGCRQYTQRPETCRRFECAWLADAAWPLRWRPDASGVMCLREEVETGVHAAAIYEIRPEALAQPVTAEILEHLKHTTAIIAVINLNQERRLVHGGRRVDPGKSAVRRPHFLTTIGRSTELPMRRLRSAS